VLQLRDNRKALQYNLCATKSTWVEIGKSARFDWVSFYTCRHNITLTCRRFTTLSVPTTGN
jgi:hypothetical protein